jgi:hypothetical protein
MSELQKTILKIISTESTIRIFDKLTITDKSFNDNNQKKKDNSKKENITSRMIKLAANNCLKKKN